MEVLQPLEDEELVRRTNRTNAAAAAAAATATNVAAAAAAEGEERRPESPGVNGEGAVTWDAFWALLSASVGLCTLNQVDP